MYDTDTTRKNTFAW